MQIPRTVLAVTYTVCITEGYRENRIGGFYLTAEQPAGISRCTFGDARDDMRLWPTPHEVPEPPRKTSRPVTTSICSFGSVAGTRVSGSPSSRRTIFAPWAMALAL